MSAAAPASAAGAGAGAVLAQPSEPVQGRPSGRGKSGWTALTPLQQQSLGPLADTWDNLSAAHRRKWLALSENFPRLSPEEQQRLHSRMRDWAALSMRQRAQARLNFGEAEQLSAAEKKALWEAYQALPAEEKKQLAAGARPRPPVTAAAVKPVARQKLATLPSAPADTRTPRIAAGAATETAVQELAPGRPGHDALPAH